MVEHPLCMPALDLPPTSTPAAPPSSCRIWKGEGDVGETVCTNRTWTLNAYKYLESGCQEDGARLFPVVPSDRTRGNGHSLKQRKFQLNMRKNFFPLRVMEPWHRLPREVVESPSLEIFKTRPDKVLCSLLWVTLLWQGSWTR